METTARIRSFEISPARFVQVAWTNVFLLWLIVGTGAAVREERPRVRRVREPARRRRRDHGHAADLARGAKDARATGLDAEARARGPDRRARPGAARVPRSGERPALARRDVAPPALDGVAR